MLLDADLQIDAEQILPLVARLEAAGADVAVGSKYHPAARRAWPWHRAALSRLYHLMTALLFRLPLRDTQTGLKVLRREMAARIVPQLTSRRFAWDLELLHAALRAGAHVVVGPVDVLPSQRSSRVTGRAALHAGWDTLRIAWRDKALARGPRRAPRRRPPTTFWVTADDLGLSARTNEGIEAGFRAGALDAASVLLTGPDAVAGMARLRALGAPLGLHLDLLGERPAHAFLLELLRGRLPGREVAARTRAQLRILQEAGLTPTHIDAHCHAYAWPAHRRAVARAAAAEGIRVMRSLRAGAGFGGQPIHDRWKRALLRVADVCSRGAAHAAGLCEADAFVDVQTAAAWARARRLPPWVRGRTIEIVGHPCAGAFDGPPHEDGVVDRVAETRALMDPPLAGALRALGAEVVAPATWARSRKGKRDGT